MLLDGVQVMLFQSEFLRPGLFKWRLWRLGRLRLRRLHRKMAVMDGSVAFVGGINVIDDLDLPTPELPPRFDFAVRVEGPLAASAWRPMNRLWQSLTPKGLREREPGPSARGMSPVGEDTAAIVLRDNIRHRRDIELAYLRAIRAAKHEIILANAYFLPGTRFRQALIDAAGRGVSVRVLLEGRAEYRLVYYATQSLYGSLLHGGVRIFEYDRSFLHAKVAVIDSDWATVGSSNIDPFSLLLAQEANLVTRTPAFATKLRAALLEALEHGAHELKPEDWQHANPVHRLLRFGSYQIVRLLFGAVGFGFEDPSPKEAKLA
jgi:cardiolipin synthase